MNSKKMFYLIILLTLTTCCIKVSATDIIPRPTHIQEMPGSFLLSSETMIVNYGSTVNEANFLKEVLKKEFNLNLINSGAHATNAIYLILNSSQQKQLGTEGYELIVNKEQIKITANHAAGIFYAIQTLRQLIIKPSEKIEYTIPCIKIMDQPRFKWREFMLDESRHFQGADVVKHILDEMAFLKMNTFHWHLTDNQGWRIEIKKYPNLTIIGSKRDSSEIREGDDITGFRYSYDNKPHEGFYTQQQIKNIIQYASGRHITIIPEIEMPDHSVAAIASYPWLGTENKQIPVGSKNGRIPYGVNLANPQVIIFFENVLQEVVDLFPSKVIHVGGDEVDFEPWKKSSDINAFIKQKGFSSYADLQLWFTSKITKYLEKKGRRAMGWNEIMGSNIHEESPEDYKISIKDMPAPGSIIDFWMGDIHLISDAISKGYDIVNSNQDYTYMNHALQSLEKAYSFDPIPEGLDVRNQHKILGLSCHLWSEWIPTEKKLNYMIYPRLAAFAEVGWTNSENKDFTRFQRALLPLQEHWDRVGINYGK